MDEKPSSNGPKPHVVVLGGGLAGMAAACHLLDAGHPVTLVEKRPFLGGRAFSFFHPFRGQDGPDGSTAESVHSADGDDTARLPAAHETSAAGFPVDNGQHVFLGCCDYYIDFLRKLGTLDSTYLQPSLRVKVVSPPRQGRKGKAGLLAGAPFPAPFHLLPSFVSYPHLGVKDKLLALYALLKIRFTDRHKPELENQTFMQWLKANGQTDRAIENFWNLLILPTLNDHVRDVSASMGMMIYQDGVIKSRTSANVGYALVGLSDLMGNAAEEYIGSRGGRLLLGKQVSEVLVSESGGRAVRGVRLASGETVEGDVYVSALPFHTLTSVLPADLNEEPFFAGIGRIAAAPIVNVHIWYDREVMEPSSPPFTAFVNSPLQWVFDKSSILRLHGNGRDAASEGQYICISVSGAWDYADKPKEEIRRVFTEAMAEAFPRAREAQIKELLIVKSTATFRCTPGSARLRPANVTPVGNLFLAGDWTDTGWPSTMESAVRSGVAAARAIAAGDRDG